ncbi:MAG: hypothetical protein RLZ45_2990, partial [Verrucomicrobiota bacterium]
MESLEPRILLAGDGLPDPQAPSRPDASGSDVLEVVSWGADSSAQGVLPGSGGASQNALDDLFEGVGDDWVATEVLADLPSSSVDSDSARTSGRVRPAGDSDPVAPMVFEIDGVLRLTVAQYSLNPGGNPGDPFATATGATLEFLNDRDFGPVTLSSVGLHGSASDLTGFRVDNLKVTVATGGVGPTSGRYFDFSGLTYEIPSLQASRGADGWQLDAGSMTVSIDSARLLPGRPDLVSGELTDLRGSLDLVDGTFSLTGDVQVEIGNTALFAGSALVSRSIISSVVLSEGQGTHPLDLFRVELRSGNLFVGAGGRFDGWGGIDTIKAVGFSVSEAFLGIAVAQVAGRGELDTRQWIGVAADGFNLTSVGVTEFVAEITRLEVRYNGASGDADAVAGSGNEAKPISWRGLFSTGPPWSEMTASVPLSIQGTARFSWQEAFMATGSFTVEQVSKDGIEVVSFDLSGVSVFVGSGAQWHVGGGINTSRAMGFVASVNRVTLALGAGDGAAEDSREWVGLALRAGEMTTVGLPEGSAATVHSLRVDLDLASGSQGGTSAAPLAWSQWLGVDSPLSTLPPNTPFQISGTMEIGIDGFILVASGFQFRSFSTQNVDVSGGVGARVDLETMVFSLTDAAVFAGMGGRFTSPSNPDRFNLAGSVGFLASGLALDWALSRVRNAVEGDTRRWTGLLATSGAFSGVGLPQGYVASVTQAGLGWNSASGTDVSGGSPQVLGWGTVLGASSRLAALESREHLGILGTLLLTLPELGTVSGTFGIGSSGTALVAASTGASVRLGVGSTVRVDVRGSIFGLQLNPDATLALQSTGGTAELNLGSGFASVSAMGVGLGINTTGSNTDQIVTVRAGGTLVSAPVRVDQGTASLVVSGLQARVSQLVTIAGDFGMRASASGLVAASANASARLTVGDTVRVGVVGGVMGFRVTPTGKVVLQATGGMAEVNLGSGFVEATAAGVGVVVNTTGKDVHETVRVAVGGSDVAAPLQVEKGIAAVVVTGLRATLSNAVTITGDFGMKVSQGGLVAASVNASALVTAGSVLRAGVTGAVLGLRVNANGTIALQSSGGQAVLDLGSGFVSVTSAEAGITFNNTGAAVFQKVSIDVGRFSVLAPIRVDAGVLSLWIRGLEAQLAGHVTVSGDFGIRASGAGLVAVSTNASALLLAGDRFRMGLDQAVVAFRVNPDGTLLLQATGGNAVLDLGSGFVSATAMGVGVAFNNSGADVQEKISVGWEGRAVSASLNVAGQTAVMVMTGFEAQMAGSVTIQGSFGLRLLDKALVGVSSNASAQLMVGGIARVGVKGSTVGFRLNADGTVVLQATGGSAILNPGSALATATATGVGVAYNNTGMDA